MESFVDPKVDRSVEISLSKLDKGDILCEFLECFVHQVLYSRKLYDDVLFETRKLYNMFVKKSRHPQLNTYLHETLFTLQDMISQDVFESIEILFLEPNGELTESVAFKLQGEIAAPCKLEILETSFREMLVSVMRCLSNRPSLSKECDFELSITTKAHLPQMFRPFWCLKSTSAFQPFIVEPIKSTKLGESCECMIYTRFTKNVESN